jgi:hypothetical protein
MPIATTRPACAVGCSLRTAVLASSRVRWPIYYRHQAGVLSGPGIARINRATCSGSSSWTKCRALGIRYSLEPGRNSWNVRATPLFTAADYPG